jgi:hypothetical protein
MRKKLIYVALALALSAPAFAQSREVTDSGAFIIDEQGRYVRLEGPDGVVADYMFDEGELTKTSGVTVRVNDKLTLTVRYDDHGGFAVDGLPAITSVVDHEYRSTAVQADGRTVARLDYTRSGLVAAVTLPGRLVWKVSAPDATRHVRQSVEDTAGKVVATAMAKAVDGRRHAWYGATAADVGVSLDSVTYEHSPTGVLTTARDADGRVAFYIVHVDRCSVGFSPEGKPRFYDLTLSVFGGTIAPGSDLMVSPAWEAQRATVPDHLLLTASGTAGLYVEENAKSGIVAAWAGRDGKVCVVQAEDDTPAPASR